MVFYLKYILLAVLSFTLPYQSLAKRNWGSGSTPLNSFLSGQDLHIRDSDQEPGTFTPPGDFGGLVRWQDWTSKDGILIGGDRDGILYVRDLLNIFLGRIASDRRTGIFWSGGNVGPDAFKDIDEFIATELNGNGIMYFNWINGEDYRAMGIDPDERPRPSRYWRMVNRSSKALAAGLSGGKAYVFMKPTNCRTIFSPSSQNPKDYDPTAGGQATVGEVWRFSELPTLMRNLNINQIIIFYKEDGQFKTIVGWDVNVDTDKPRDFLPDNKMDTTPLILPPESGRPPLKRGEDAYNASDSIIHGVF